MEINRPITTILILVISLILIFLFATPKYQKSSSLQDMLAQKEAEYNANTAYYAKISELIKSIESRKDTLEKINSALPSDVSLAPLVYFFQKKATEAGLTTKSVMFSQISAATAKEDIRDITFTVTVSG